MLDKEKYEIIKQKADKLRIRMNKNTRESTQRYQNIDWKKKG